MKKIPFILVIFRACVAVFLLLDGFDKHLSTYFVPLFVLASLSDIFDGVIARKYNIVTEFLRRADSVTDLYFYACIFISLYSCFGSNIQSSVKFAFLVLIFLQVVSWVFSLIKFRQLTSYHSCLAKAWGLSLFVLVLDVCVNQQFGRVFWISALIACLSLCEDIVITFILQKPQYDVLSIVDAFKRNRATTKC